MLWLLCAAPGAVALLAAAEASPAAQDSHDIRTDSKSPYVHRINLLDANSGMIAKGENKPYSPRLTCGKCHDYAAISRGWHFNSLETAADPAKAGRMGQPWVLVDGELGTQLPLSYRAWPGAYRPGQVGLSPWRFVKVFGRHMPGGGPGEPTNEQIKTFSKEEQGRWQNSGKLEIDCLSCHNADAGQDQAEQASQIVLENLRWAPGVTSGLVIVRGQAKDLPADFDPIIDEEVAKKIPKVIYSDIRFDKDDRVFLNITKRIPSSRCYFCHTARPVGPRTESAWRLDTDVHLAAGLACVDCHRHGMDHAMVRGYETEKVAGDTGAVSSLSCRGCHMGQDSAAGGPASLGGRMGAPVPAHVGLPTLHLEKLTCTVCHSGPWPMQGTGSVQTARAHRLGLPANDHPPEMLPRIAEPLFVRQADGKIGLHRMIWPAFWGRLKDEKVAPIPPDEVKALLVKEPAPAPGQTKPSESPHEERVARVLKALLKQDKALGEPVYVAGGRLFRLTADGKVVGATHPAAGPCSWPFAHDVRPAKQSLGSGGCTDCHAADSPVLFGQTEAASPFPLGEKNVKFMYELMGVDKDYHKLFGLSFVGRPMMKVVCSVAAAIIALVLILYAFRGLGVLLKAAGGKPRKT